MSKNSRLCPPLLASYANGLLQQKNKASRVGQLVGRLVGQLVSWSVGRSFGWLVDWLAGWLVGQLSGYSVYFPSWTH